jgi:hypothetical protein
MNIRVEVTARDIKRGVACDGCNCPVALATRRAIRQQVGGRPSCEVSVAGHTAMISGQLAKLPKRAEHFILAFDTLQCDRKRLEQGLQPVGPPPGIDPAKVIRPFEFALRIKSPARQPKESS